ncbi:MAG: hypothetical protein KJ947_04555 [Alphaproteobacteria bacterium]|jgi:hypothetical protein|nr:hypothetical protein [Alphaproteobacteria bacterium]MBU1548836.1 hypothetical protein [Alphaproteobacteria bacterium]MBU2335662.1 hypothetical protein [Alphaproteobacteria bacterium]MBU2390943.1 hypothetical protein [Alphaproteobacteria bacterium]
MILILSLQGMGKSVAINPGGLKDVQKLQSERLFSQMRPAVEEALDHHSKSANCGAIVA